MLHCIEIAFSIIQHSVTNAILKLKSFIFSYSYILNFYFFSMKNKLWLRKWIISKKKKIQRYFRWNHVIHLFKTSENAKLIVLRDIDTWMWKQFFLLFTNQFSIDRGWEKENAAVWFRSDISGYEKSIFIHLFCAPESGYHTIRFSKMGNECENAIMREHRERKLLLLLSFLSFQFVE